MGPGVSLAHWPVLRCRSPPPCHALAVPTTRGTSSGRRCVTIHHQGEVIYLRPIASPIAAWLPTVPSRERARCMQASGSPALACQPCPKPLTGQMLRPQPLRLLLVATGYLPGRIRTDTGHSGPGSGQAPPHVCRPSVCRVSVLCVGTLMRDSAWIECRDLSSVL